MDVPTETARISPENSIDGQMWRYLLSEAKYDEEKGQLCVPCEAELEDEVNGYTAFYQEDRTGGYALSMTANEGRLRFLTVRIDGEMLSFSLDEVRKISG